MESGSGGMFHNEMQTSSAFQHPPLGQSVKEEALTSPEPMMTSREEAQPVAANPSRVFCAGCGQSIADRFYLVAVDRTWHSECLRCSECQRTLDTAHSCFARQNRIYCKDDYYRSFAYSFQIVNESDSAN